MKIKNYEDVKGTIDTIKAIEALKEEQDALYDTLDKQLKELGLETMFQDEETGIVYQVVKPAGRFVKYSDIYYTRTKKEGERAGTLSKKAAVEAGFNVA